MKNIVEICTGSYADCIAAAKGGASRVELNSALSVGGLSPSLTVLQKVKAETKLKVICMVRPRAAGFCYQEDEFAVMLEEAKLFLASGADGIAFGFLEEDGSIQIPYTKEMIQCIHSYGKEAVFHRAFDVTRDSHQAMQQLIACKADRVLTSGQQIAALQGVDLISELQSCYGDKIEILAGGGVNADNVRELLQKSGVHQVHSSCKTYRKDPTTRKKGVSYAYLPSPHEDAYDIVDLEKVKALVRTVENS